MIVRSSRSCLGELAARRSADPFGDADLRSNTEEMAARIDLFTLPGGD